jgi:hypothetical protein
VADQAGARGNLDVFGLPQGERIHGSGRPGPARIAVAISHRLRRSVHFDFDSSAEAVPLDVSPCSFPPCCSLQRCDL